MGISHLHFGESPSSDRLRYLLTNTNSNEFPFLFKASLYFRRFIFEEVTRNTNGTANPNTLSLSLFLSLQINREIEELTLFKIPLITAVNIWEKEIFEFWKGDGCSHFNGGEMLGIAWQGRDSEARADERTDVAWHSHKGGSWLHLLLSLS